jgi:ACR3 family arsenite efflux pump ArsB
MNVPKRQIFTTFYNPPTPRVLGLKLVFNFTFAPLFVWKSAVKVLHPEQDAKKEFKNI